MIFKQFVMKRKASNMKKSIMILGIDTFEKKNIAQIVEMNKKNFSYYVFTNDRRNVSLKNFSILKNTNKLIITKRNILARCVQFFKLISQNDFNHVELYAAGRMTFFYILICKIFSMKIIVVERGDIGHLQNHNFLTKLAIKIAYKVADLIWYKEPYMEKLISKYTSPNKLIFLPNAAPNTYQSPAFSRKIDFLWVNRLVNERRADWLVNCLNDNCFKEAVSIFLGFQPVGNSVTLELQEYVKKNNANNNTSIVDFSDPYEYYAQSKFFVLPAEIVFGNNSLLEAMSMGVVPIVSKTESTNLIVKDAKNGLVFTHTENDLRNCLAKALGMNNKEWKRLSNNARKTIEEHYSQKQWSNRCYKMYEAL